MSNEVTFTAEKAHRVLNFLHELGGKGLIPQNHNHASQCALDLTEKDNDRRPETEIERLKEDTVKLEAEKETGLAQFYKLLKKASDLESRVMSAEEESRVLKEQASKYDRLQKKLLDAEEHAKIVAEKAWETGDEVERLKKDLAKMEGKGIKVASILKELIDEKLCLEIEKDVLFIFVEVVAYEADQVLRKNVVLENEKALLSSQVKKLHDLVEGLKIELGQTLDDNEVLVMQKTVLIWLFGEMKIEAAEAEGLSEVLRLKERNDHDEKLKVGFEDLNVELSELRESYMNLQNQMTKVVQENTVLKKNFLELKQQIITSDENSTMFNTPNNNMCHEKELMLETRLQLLEVEKDTVFTNKEKLCLEDSIEVIKRECSEEFISMDVPRDSTHVQVLKKTTSLDRMKNVEKIIDYTKVAEIEYDLHLHKTLGDELQYQCSGSLDDPSVCRIKHMTPQKHFTGLKMAAPRWGLKIGKWKSDAGSHEVIDAPLDQHSKNGHYEEVNGDMW